MPRVGRKAPGGLIYHVINRGNGRQKLFHKPADYEAFVNLLFEVAAVVPVRILAFCLMPNHWHLVLWPTRDGDLSNFMLRLTTAHVRRHFAHHHNHAGGHLYQGRFKSFPTQDNHHLLVVLRYVEANARRANLVTDARRWAWSSAALRFTRPADAAKALCNWPIDRPKNWTALLNDVLPKREFEAIQASLRRGRPFGTPQWTQATAKRLGLDFTLRPRGRPRQTPANDANC